MFVISILKLWIVLIFPNFHCSLSNSHQNKNKINQLNKENILYDKILLKHSPLVNHSSGEIYFVKEIEPWRPMVTIMTQDEKGEKVKQERVIELLLFISCMHEWLAQGVDFTVDQATQMVKNASNLLLEINFSLILKRVELPVNDSCIIPLNTTAKTASYEDLIAFVEENEEKFVDFDSLALLLPTGYLIIDNVTQAIGVTNQGSMCYFTRTDATLFVGHNNEISRYATLAHEIGHTLGLNHDDPSLEGVCPYDDCIMAASEPAEPYTSETTIGFSQTSKDQIEELLKENSFACTRQRFEDEEHKYCGNGIVEENEECDCFTRANCSNCCDELNCTLINDATCTSGSCCNLDTCSVYTDNFICRQSTDECDLEEKCDGITTDCPEDVFVHDGIPCDVGNGYCINGACGSYEMACEKLFTHTESASDECYALNKQGSFFANCGPLYGFISETPFDACEDKNIKCGSLWCGHESIERKSYVSANLTKTSGCTTLTFRYLPVELSIDLGHVPDGAPCQPNNLCMNQMCVPVSSIANNSCPFNCHYRGICTSIGTCFCHNSSDKSPDCINSPIRKPGQFDNLRFLEIIFQLSTIGASIFFLLSLTVIPFLRLKFATNVTSRSSLE